jgi:hypothetical protein
LTWQSWGGPSFHISVPGVAPTPPCTGQTLSNATVLPLHTSFLWSPWWKNLESFLKLLFHQPNWERLEMQKGQRIDNKHAQSWGRCAGHLNGDAQRHHYFFSRLMLLLCFFLSIFKTLLLKSFFFSSL